MKKIISVFILIIFIIFLLNYDLLQNKIFESIDLWLHKIVLSFIPLYLFANLFYVYKPISTILNSFFKINKHSLSIFLTSMVIGCPTNSYLIENCLNDNQITSDDAINLLKCTNFMSPLFLFLMLDYDLFIKIVLCQLIINSFYFIVHFRKTKTLQNDVAVQKDFLFNIPTILLNILVTIIVCNLVINLVLIIFKFYNINYLLSFLEISNGLNFLTKKTNLINKLFVCLLISFNGLAIILQQKSALKKTRIKFSSFIIFKIFYALITSLGYLFIELLF